MPKKTPPNGFMLFVMKRKREEESKGVKFGNINDAISKFSEEWEPMTAEEREPFNSQAKAKKEAMRKEAAENPVQRVPQASNVNSNHLGLPG